MEPVGRKNTIVDKLSEPAGRQGNKETIPAKTDTIEISNTAKVYDKVDKFFNLGREGRADLSKMNKKEKDEFLKMTADLIKKGVVGFEVLNVNGKPEKHFIETEIGDQRIKGAKLYKKKGYYKD